jgi:ubiquinone/menaquinone biosynthesis C-methylase UbiE
MKPAEKQAYLEEYEILKKKGKPFFPYAVLKDSAMALIVVAVIIVMSLVLGAEQGPKADPTTTTYVPRPEWYFFFLFEVLRVIKPPELVPIATIGIPTVCMVLLLLLPFYDRGPERRPERRPLATTAGCLTILAMAYLTYAGATGGSPTEIDMKVAPQYQAGKEVVAGSGCLACHKLGENGNNGPGPELTHIAARIPRAAIIRSVEIGPGIMPSFRELPKKKLNELADFLSSLNSRRRAAEGGRPLGVCSVCPSFSPAMDTINDNRSSPDFAGQVNRMFDRVAGRYDTLNGVMTAGLHHRWRERAAALARLGPGDSALDVCCGTGDLALEGVRFEWADALELPYDGERFDAVTVGFGVRNLADLDRGLREMARVLKPGGRLVILEITQPTRPPLSLFYSLWFDRIVPLLGALSDEPEAYSYLPESVRSFPSPSGLAAKMDRAGFERIRYTVLAGGIIAIHSGARAPARG